MIGAATESLATIEATVSYVSDTPDFFRRADRPYPVHGNRFTGEPAYFNQVRNASQALMTQLGVTPEDVTYAVFHQPNARFPQVVAKQMGFRQEQIAPGLLADKIGNTYSAAAILGLCATLDVANPGELILMTSYGSGSGADAYLIRVGDAVLERRNKAPLTATYVTRETMIDYAVYAKWRNKLVMG